MFDIVQTELCIKSHIYCMSKCSSTPHSCPTSPRSHLFRRQGTTVAAPATMVFPAFPIKLNVSVNVNNIHKTIRHSSSSSSHPSSSSSHSHSHSHSASHTHSHSHSKPSSSSTSKKPSASKSSAPAKDGHHHTHKSSSSTAKSTAKKAPSKH
ncbi:hypothetical protein WOLCODRAFT_167795 [Wolfiporia cocos MD-104 SS10]|uniref:Uncharacterized protein n=1 Tax=Wolfiporia cocos (strain MD-104) TaxID=742152 RepID=A0A2H3JGU7_WOLCO|nr:hypothetical protein WOLCODRAFT_167795 [Wolfiporia cocos MD-104 SS10]